MVDSFDAVSPLDGRYEERTAPLREYTGEAALIRERVRVEITYLLALADNEEVPLSLVESERSSVQALIEDFDQTDAERIKQLETEGTEDRPPTQHDVKAVEYHIRDQLPEKARPWVHFGLTSADVNNLARRRLLRGALREILIPAFRRVRDRLIELARVGRATPMPARTHGQVASPTTFGKECAVFATRLGRMLGQLRAADADLQGKLSGATGTYAAQVVTLPAVDWRTLCGEVVSTLGFEPVEPTTQISPGDDLAAVFDALRRVTGVCLDCTRDMWRYISDGYLQQATDEAVGSSTMPQKINPINFENAEGNLQKGQADLAFLSRELTTSRLQRDLSDSTLKRSISATLGHLQIAATKLAAGLEAIEPDTAAMRTAVENNPVVLAEAVQTALRVGGHLDAYERVKEATRGQSVTREELKAIVREANLPPSLRDRLLALEPADYVGLAPELADLASESD